MDPMAGVIDDEGDYMGQTAPHTVPVYVAGSIASRTTPNKFGSKGGGSVSPNRSPSPNRPDVGVSALQIMQDRLATKGYSTGRMTEDQIMDLAHKHKGVCPGACYHKFYSITNCNRASDRCDKCHHYSHTCADPPVIPRKHLEGANGELGRSMVYSMNPAIAAVFGNWVGQSIYPAFQQKLVEDLPDSAEFVTNTSQKLLTHPSTRKDLEIIIRSIVDEKMKSMEFEKIVRSALRDLINEYQTKNTASHA